MQSHSLVRLLGAAGLLLPLTLGAQEQVARLDPIVVTPSRTAETADRALAAVTVIDRETIDRLQPQSLVDALRTVPGLDVSRAGGFGGNTSVRLRGTESDHTLVLVDGVRVSSGTGGEFNWRSLDPSQIERIEIVRGPRAALYGSDAIGGVIQIFTREANGPRVRVQAGTNQSQRGEVGMAGGETVRYNLNASFFSTDGYPVRTPRSPAEKVDSGTRKRNVSGSLVAPLGDDVTISLRAWVSDADVEYDARSGFDYDNGDPVRKARSDTRNAFGAATFDHDISRGWSQTLQLGYALDRLDDRAPPNAGGVFDRDDRIQTRRQTASWIHALRLDESQQLTLGADYERAETLNRSRLTGQTAFDETTDTVGAFGQWQTSLDRIDLQVAARHDRHSEFGSSTTGSVATGYAFSPTVRAFVSAATAFKAPTANELYYPNFGNPDLNPEKSRSAELGLGISSPDQIRETRASVFLTRVDDLIGFDFGTFLAENIDSAEIRGFELSHSVMAGPWRFDLSGTLQKAIDRDTGERLVRRPDEKASLTISRTLANGAVLSVEGFGASEARDGGTTLPGYGIVNAAYRQPLDNGFALEARVDNLFDKEYESAHSFQAPGLHVFLGLSWTPGR
ncbi:MAG: TonB-dependent receptor [Aquisalimonadaceae bacterium]